mgnify:CR=1 FL=1
MTFTPIDYNPNDFANRRHIGPSPAEMEEMLKVVGVKTLILTNAAGGVNVQLTPGTLMVGTPDNTVATSALSSPSVMRISRAPTIDANTGKCCSLSAYSFIVHDPSGIIVRSSARSRSARRRR